MISLDHQTWALRVIIEQMHGELDEAIDVIRYASSARSDTWENDHPDEPRPDWLDE
jgi:hypothetical protein